MSILLGAKSTVTKWANEATAKTASLALGSESNRIVIGVVSIGSGLDSTPTFNGVAMVLAKEQYNASSGYARIYYMLEASLPGAGTYNFSVDPDAATYGCMAVYYIYNAKQQAPEATGGASGTLQYPQTYITTLTNNAFVADCINHISGTNGVPWSNAYEYFDDYSSSRGFTVGSKVCPVAGSNYIGWNLSQSVAYAHALAAFETVSGLDDSNTKSLLHCDGGDTFTTIIDESGKSWGVGGNAQLDTSQYKFGAASLQSDGSGDYAYRDSATPDNDFAPSADFTIDFWIRFNNTAGAQIIYDSRPASTSGYYLTIYKDGTSHVIKFFTNAADRITGSTSVAINTWYHIALARSGSSTKLFLNGNQEGSTYSDSNTYINAAYRPLLLIDNNVTYCVNGRMDEFRFSLNTCRWTANFTPPSSPYGSGAPASVFVPKIISF